jgi:hypothetical protein
MLKCRKNLKDKPEYRSVNINEDLTKIRNGIAYRARQLKKLKLVTNTWFGVAADAYDCGYSLTRVSPCEDLGVLCSDDLVLMSLITLIASLPISLASLFSAVTLLTNTTLSRTFTKIVRYHTIA